MPKLLDKLEEIASDMTSSETCVRTEEALLAYTKFEFEGDSVSWIADLPAPLRTAVVELHKTQTLAAQESKFAVLGMIASVLKTVKL